MKKHILKRVMGVAACAVIAVGAADFALNRLCYHPYQDFGSNAKTFALTVQAMIPSAAFAYVMPYSPGSPRHFSVFSQEFYIHQDSRSRDINTNYLLSGTFHYSLGNITPTYTHKKEEPLVYRQSDFTEAAGLSLDTMEDAAYYTAYIGFSAPKTTEALMDGCRALFGGAYGDSVDFEERFAYIQEHGVQWIGVVAFARGSVLKALSAAPAMHCFRLEADVPADESPAA